MIEFLKPDTTISECIQLFFDDDFRLHFLKSSTAASSLPRYKRFISGCDMLIAFYDGLYTIASWVNLADRTMIAGLVYDAKKKIKGWRDNLPIEVYSKFE